MTESEREERDNERREQVIAEELEHLANLRDRIQQGMDEKLVDIASGTEMLLNVSRARAALGGIKTDPETK